MHRFIVILALQILVAGCGSGPAPVSGLGLRDRSVLTVDEIMEARTNSSNAYELIQKLRPEYFRSRGPSSFQSLTPLTAVVYVDDMRYGEIQTLRGMGADQIYLVRYINASDATTRFGTDHVGGAILITTK